MESDGILIGDVFWDEHHKWSDGDDNSMLIYIVLSGETHEDGHGAPFYYRCSRHAWCCGGYCGGPVREFTASEVLQMTKVGNIAQIKSFTD